MRVVSRKSEAIFAERTKNEDRFGIYVAEDKKSLDAYAWPGGYTIVYYRDDGDALCAKCATEKLSDVDAWKGDLPTMCDVYYEGPVQECIECDCALESAYGDPAKT